MAENIVTLRNAGSDIDNMVNVIATLYSVFGSQSFNLKDLTRVATEEKLMSSNGRIGEQARERSYNKNVSLDSMPMQFKAYAEIFRLLGWLRSEDDKKRTTYRITYIGKHISQEPIPYKLIEQSYLGIDLPNNVVLRDCVNEVRLLWCYLRTIRALGNKATKHELIYVCHFINDDEDISEFSERINYIIESRKKRGHSKSLINELTILCSEAKPKPITLNTINNSTRITLSALKFNEFNWTEYNRPFYSLTSYGKTLVDSYDTLFKPRLSTLQLCSSTVQDALSIIGLVNIFKRSGFDTEELEIIYDYKKQIEILISNNLIKDASKDVWFSPYQTLSPSKIIRLFGSKTESIEENKVPNKFYDTTENFKTHPKVGSTKTSYLASVEKAEINSGDNDGPFVKIIKHYLISENDDVKKTISKVHDHYRLANKDIYYPLVAEAFNVLGFNCKVQRHGQNSLRWDAIIIDGKKTSIPIEIKSPTEEEFISVKAIRQALENRVIRCARYQDNIALSSYVVGFKYPAERAEVNELIEYIYKAFNIKIALFSLETLTNLVIKSILEKKAPAKQNFFSLIGNVDSI